MAKRLLYIFVCLLFAQCLVAQNAVGEWSKHGVFGNSFTRVIETNTDVYYLADGWLYSFSKENQETHNLSGEGDLNDVSINNIYYNTDKKYLLVAYANGNIDIIKDGGEVINMPDIYIRSFII